MNISSDYIAGLIDGEGYLALLPVKSKQTKNQSYEPVVKIGMTGETALTIFTQMKAKYGGNVETRNTLSKGNRVVHTYILKSKPKVLALLEDIHVSLIVKQEQSKLLKEFCLMPSSHTRYSTFEPRVVERKEQIFTELKQLKQQPLATTE